MYALPAHTYRKTQPCDVTLFDNFKRELNDCIGSAEDDCSIDLSDNYNFCCMIHYAYNRAFTHNNITAEFEKSSIWPVDHKRVMNVRLPRATEDVSTLLNVDQMEELMVQNRMVVRDSILCINTIVTQSGFVDTNKGAVLTSEWALQVVREVDSKKTAKKATKNLINEIWALREVRQEEK